MANTTTKPTDTPAEPEPKQRPVKRSPKRAYVVPRGIAWIDEANPTVTIRVKAGDEVDEGVIPTELEREYLKRGDIVAITTH